MEIEISTQLKLDDAVIADDVTVTIDARFREFVNASGDGDFELEDYDIMGVHWESPITGIEAHVAYPEHDFRKSDQQKELDNQHRQKVSKMLESLRTFIPMTDGQIADNLISQYATLRAR